MNKLSFVQDREDLEKHLICPCFIISFLSKKKENAYLFDHLNISKIKKL